MGSGNSITTAAAGLGLTPRLCQLNKLRGHHFFTGQRLKVVKEEVERRKVKEAIAEQTEDLCNSQGVVNSFWL